MPVDGTVLKEGPSPSDVRVLQQGDVIIPLPLLMLCSDPDSVIDEHCCSFLETKAHGFPNRFLDVKFLSFTFFASSFQRLQTIDNLNRSSGSKMGNIMRKTSSGIDWIETRNVSSCVAGCMFQ